MFGNLGDIDPMLQLLALVAIVAFVAIAGFKTWRYLQKRRMRERSRTTWF
jgi:uncharacterized membrane protein